ncbi:MAG: LLM class flavin-dependent oxidoreductase [Solirubrobacteraceae bacterium]
MRLSVLDQSPVSEGSTGAQALANTLDLARLTDALGYHRYWLAEHHGAAMLAGPAPEALIGPVAAATSRIRVGSGGVMLPHYSPFKVAETFSVLAALYPGRIDLGLGRAAGTDPLTTFALQSDRRQASQDDFPDQLAELLAYLRQTMPEEHPFARLQHALPGGDELPVPWLLGSSTESAVWARGHELPYAFADFINPGAADIHLAKRPEAIAVWALAAETDEEAQRLVASSRMAMLELRRGNPIPVPDPETALAYLREVPRHRQHGGRRAVIGTPAKVRAGREEVAEAYGASEVIVVTITHDHGARRRSYELLAEACGLEAAPRPQRAAVPS